MPPLATHNTDPQTLIDGPRPGLPGWVRVSLAVMIVAKLVLVSHEEILPYLQDDTGYAHMAGSYYWQAGYGLYSYAKQPVYPLFVSGTMLLGIPTRLVQELLWAVASIALATAIWRVRLGGIAALAAAGLTLFHPWSIEVLNRLLLDALYAPLFIIMLASLASGLAATSRADLRFRSVTVAIAGALAANTRPEAVLVYGTLAVTALAIFAMWRLRLCDRRLATWRLAALVLIPFASVVGVTQAIKAANYARIGSWVHHDLTMPGFAALYNALLAIPPQHARLDIPIPREVRERAYAASPTFARLRPCLDAGGPPNEFMAVCKATTGVDGEYGGWTLWVLRHAAWHVNGDDGWRSAGELDAFYAQAAGELRAAMARGELPSRSVPLSFVAPEWRLMLGAAPASLARCWRTIMTPAYRRDYTHAATDADLAAFNAVANRRTAPARISSGQHIRGSNWHRPGTVEAADRAKASIAAGAGVALRLGLWLGGAGILLSLIAIRRAWLPPAYYALLALFATAMAGRIALVVLLDLNAFPILVRYLLPVVPMLIGLQIAGIAAGGVVIRSFIDSRRRRDAGPGPDQRAVISSASAPAS